MNFLSNISISLLCMFCTVSALGQDGQFEVELSQDTVLAGEQFSITYKISGVDSNDFQLPDLGNFRIVSGPNVSSSMSFINGVVNQEASYNLILISTTPGDFVIPAVELSANDKVHTFEELKIHVLENPNMENLEDLYPRNPLEKQSKKKRKTFKI